MCQQAKEGAARSASAVVAHVLAILTMSPPLRVDRIVFVVRHEPSVTPIASCGWWSDAARLCQGR